MAEVGIVRTRRSSVDDAGTREHAGEPHLRIPVAALPGGRRKPMILTQSELDSLALQELPGKANGAKTGHIHQRERIAFIADRCCSQVEGDLIEIGSYCGDTSAILARVARKYDRK